MPVVPTYEECDKYFYDERAAERVINFIERFCTHYEGRFAGEPFLLLDWQKQIIRTLFGWKKRSDGLRRFRELYLITAKGAGKTPMLAAIGLYMLLADGEAASHVISMASSHEQALLTFDAGKRYIENCKPLAQMATCQQRIIKGPKHGKWTTISGKPNGRSGTRPSCVIADECHEWPNYTAQAYDLLCANLFKRSQPILLVATNAAADKQCFAWTVHERAMRVLEDPAADETLLPVIFEAPADMDWRSEEAAKAANPSMGSIVQFTQLKPELLKGEARYRRLYLSQWVTGTDKWIDMQKYAACEGVLPDREVLKTLPLFVGVDLSQGDDLCAAVYVWASEQWYYVSSEFWIPRVTADYYQERHAIAYHQWEADGHITLLEETTITPEVKRRIADQIIERADGYELRAVCYDQYKASDTIATLEAKGVTCVPVRQGYSLSPGCYEVERRLTEGSIVFEPSGPMRFCATNVEVTEDRRGNIWPVKPNAKNQYAGRRQAKIDGISSLVTAATEARKVTFVSPVPEQPRVYLL